MRILAFAALACYGSGAGVGEGPVPQIQGCKDNDRLQSLQDGAFYLPRDGSVLV